MYAIRSYYGSPDRRIKSDPEAQVIVVDDGSDDDTAGVAGAAGAQVLRHPESLGNGVQEVQKQPP